MQHHRLQVGGRQNGPRRGPVEGIDGTDARANPEHRIKNSNKISRHEVHKGHKVKPMKTYKTIPREVEKFSKPLLDAAYTIHTKLGPGLLESVYEMCLAHELKKR